MTPTPKAMKAMKATPIKAEKKMWTTKPPKPSVDDPPTFYKKGVIYCSKKRGCFRVIKRLPDYATESNVKWPNGVITAAAWNEALSKIDKFKP